MTLDSFHCNGQLNNETGKMIHPQQSDLEAYANQVLPESECASLLEHLDQCDTCAKFVEQLENAVFTKTFAVGGLIDVDTNDHCENMIGNICDQTLPGAASTGNEAEDTDSLFTESFARQGVSIDRYKLHKLVGEGGMGSVWEAEQQKPVKRRVAIKLIKDRLRTERAKVRFNAERQALAMMDHPNIAQILDAGSTKDQQPYFVMEFVDGKTLTDFCDENRFTVNQRLELFIQVCKAIEHAHQKQIIHRDLKPSNVLVGGLKDSPKIKVIDFGLSKLLDKNNRLADGMSSTQLGAVLGTIRYMAPEQAFGNPGEIDTRADIYSLGVILYELLTGSTPIGDDSNGKIEMLEKLGEFRKLEPTTPSRLLSKLEDSGDTAAQNRSTTGKRLSQMLKGDLDCIVAKALAADRSRRYETIVSFREDVQRFLDAEPISARPPSVGYRAGKFIRRNRILVIAGAAVVSILLASAMNAYWVLASSNKKLRAAAVVVEKEKTNAENEVERKREAVDFLIRTFERLDIANSNIRNSTPAVELLFNAFEDLKRNTNNRISDPLVRGELLFEVGRLLKLYGCHDKSTEAARLASEIFGATLGKETKQFFDSQIMLASSLRKAGKLEDSERLFREIAEDYPRVFPEDKLEATKRWNDVAVCLVDLKRYNEALEIYEQVIAGKSEFLGEYDRSVMLTENNVAIVYCQIGKHERAIELLESVVKRSEKVFGRQDNETMDNLYSLGFAQISSGNFKRANEIFREIVEYQEQKLAPDHMDRLSTEWLLGQSEWKMDGGSREKALLIMEGVIANVRPLEVAHPTVVQWKWKLHSHYAEVGNEVRSVELKLSVLSTLFEKGHESGTARGVANALELAKTYISIDDYSAAKKVVNQTLQTLKKMGVGELVLKETGAELVSEMRKLATQLKASNEPFEGNQSK